VPEPWLILFTYFSLQHSASQRSAIVSARTVVDPVHLLVVRAIAPRSPAVSCHPLPSQPFTESPTSFISPQISQYYSAIH
ncbi:hypothetical protein L873DRAFT_1815725, partial [Choiromyces venosus 120613-1]